MQSSRKQIISYFLVLLCLCANFYDHVHADEIRMKNGDRISGNIIKVENKKLTIKTEYAGEILLPIDALEKISSDQALYVVLADGKTVVGKVSDAQNQANKLRVDGDTGGVVVDMAGITAIRSYTEQMAFLRRTNPSWSDMWNGGMSLGYTLTTGNTSNKTLGLGGNLGRETPKDKTILYAAFAKASNKNKGFDDITAYTIRGGWRYQYNLTDRLYAFAFTDFEHNKIQYLDLRIVPGVGLGYYLIKKPNTELDIFGGISFNHENFFCRDGQFINIDARCPPLGASKKIIRNSAEALIGQGLMKKINDRVLVRERFQFFPNLTDTGQYRMTLDASVIVKLKKWLVWNMTASDRYISNPPTSSKNNDLLLTTGLGITISDFNFKRW